MSSLLKKFVFSTLIALSLFFSTASYFQTKAQSVWYNQSPAEWYLKVYDSSNPNEIFGERYTAAQVQWIIYSIPSMFINFIAGGNTEMAGCLMNVTASTVDVDACATGIINFLTDLSNNLTSKIKILQSGQESPSIASQILSDRPVSGIGYIRDLAEKLNPVSEIHAQTRGYGYSALSVIQPLWRLTRNFAFFLFVLITIVFAFMIMFRVKLSPQVVISVQSALPKIIIALILVTFSFAIAGLMIDLMYVVMGIFSAAMAAWIPGSSLQFVRTIAAKGVFAFINGFVAIPGNTGAIAIIIYFVLYIVIYVIAVIAALIASAFGLNVVSSILGLLLLIFTVILAIILLVSIFRVIFMLFKNLAEVYALIIIGPLQIAVGALFPQGGFGSWLKKLFTKLLIFPLTGIFIYIAFILLGYSIGASIYGAICGNPVTVVLKPVIGAVWGIIGTLTGAEFLDVSNPTDYCTVWSPPMLGNGASATGIAFLLMSLGIIMMIPKISQAIESFMAGKEFAGTGIGEAMGPFGGIVKGTVGTVTGAYQRGRAERFALDYEQQSTKVAKLIKQLEGTKLGQAVHLENVMRDITEGSKKH